MLTLHLCLVILLATDCCKHTLYLLLIVRQLDTTDDCTNQGEFDIKVSHLIAFPGGTLDSSNSAIYTTCASVAAGGLPMGVYSGFSLTSNCPPNTKGRYALIHGTAAGPGQALTACEIAVRGTYLGGKWRTIIISRFPSFREYIDNYTRSCLF